MSVCGVSACANAIFSKTVTGIALGQVGEGHAAQLLGARQRAYTVIAAVTGYNTVNVFQGRTSMTYANNVLPTYLCPSSPAKAASLAEPVNVIQVGDSLTFHESPAVIGVTGHRGVLNRTRLK